MKKIIDNPARGLRTWIEIDRQALKKNYSTFREMIKPNCKLMAVVKSNAYGHNLIETSQVLQKYGADFFGVDSIVEALALREAGIKKPILVLGYTLPERFTDAASNDIAITISSIDSLSALSKTENQKIKIHIKIDSGMHRQGFELKQVPEVLKKLSKLNNVIPEGIYTHFSSAKNPAFPAETIKQAGIFQEAVKLFELAKYNLLKHASATSATIIFPEYNFDTVRIGIGLYGIWPAKEIRAAFENRFSLQPALSWKTIAGEIKKISKGEGVGYDLTEKLNRNSVIAICPIGYWHGYPRSLSSIGSVLVGGKRAKILGRISMDMIAIDITSAGKIKSGDIVTLIGNKITADELAHLSDTTAYEIITRINPLIKRIFV